MKYEITYTLQKEVTVTVDVADEKLNTDFEKLGEIKSDEDFQDEFDPRWKIEQIAFDDFQSCGENVDYDVDNETIVNRAISRV